MKYFVTAVDKSDSKKKEKKKTQQLIIITPRWRHDIADGSYVVRPHFKDVH